MRTFNKKEDLLFETFKKGEKIKYKDNICKVSSFTNENGHTKLTLVKEKSMEFILIEVISS